MKKEKIKKKKIIIAYHFSLAIRNLVIFLSSFFILLSSFVSCLSVVEKTGRVLDGSASEEKKITVFRDDIRKKDNYNIEVVEAQNKTGERFLVVSLKDYPFMRFRGSMPDKDGEFFFTSFEYLSGSSNGWNQFSMAVLGGGYFALHSPIETNGGIVFAINNEIEKIEITGGRIKRYDTLITGSDALTRLRNRRERIEAAAEWMKLQNTNVPLQSIKDFEKYWEPILFPEITAKRKRPEGWLRNDDIFNKAEDINWNTFYSERVFPEELRPVRNSGTMLRDWEEAIAWIYIEYNWENIINLISEEIELKRKK